MGEGFRGVNQDKIQKDRESRKRGSDFWSPDEGDTLLYVAPCPPGVNGTPYVEAAFHFSATNKGEGKGASLCLDHEANPLLSENNTDEDMKAAHEAFMERLKEMDRDIDDLSGCTICEALDSGEFEKKIKDGSRKQTRYLFNVIPLKYRKKQSAPWTDTHESLRPYMCSFTVWDGITTVIGDLGDITDPNGAVLIVLHREGTGVSTRYQVSADAATIKKPMVLDKATKQMLRDALKDGGTGDLLRIVAAMTKDKTTQLADWSGMKVEEGGGKADADKKPSCFGVDWDDSKECAKCPHTGPCSKKSGAKKPKDTDPEPADDDADDKPADDDASEMVKAGDCAEGEAYEIKGDDGKTKVGRFTGKAGKWALFQNVEDDDDLIRVKTDVEVEHVTVEVAEPEPEPKKGKAKPADDDDDDDDAALKELEARIKAKAKGGGKGK